MPNVDQYFEEIDAARIRRARELSEIKRKFSANKSPDPAGVNSKAAIVLTYANWEGFYNECVHSYLQFLKERGGKVRLDVVGGHLQPRFRSIASQKPFC